jgi:hypothetical protein
MLAPDVCDARAADGNDDAAAIDSTRPGPTTTTIIAKTAVAIQFTIETSSGQSSRHRQG